MDVITRPDTEGRHDRPVIDAFREISRGRR